MRIRIQEANLYADPCGSETRLPTIRMYSLRTFLNSLVIAAGMSKFLESGGVDGAAAGDEEAAGHDEL